MQENVLIEALREAPTTPHSKNGSALPCGNGSNGSTPSIKTLPSGEPTGAGHMALIQNRVKIVEIRLPAETGKPRRHVAMPLKAVNRTLAPALCMPHGQFEFHLVPGAPQKGNRHGWRRLLGQRSLLAEHTDLAKCLPDSGDLLGFGIQAKRGGYRAVHSASSASRPLQSSMNSSTTQAAGEAHGSASSANQNDSGVTETPRQKACPSQRSGSHQLITLLERLEDVSEFQQDAPAIITAPLGSRTIVAGAPSR